MEISIDARLIRHGAFITIRTTVLHLSSFGHLGSKTRRKKKSDYCDSSGTYTPESSVNRWISELKRCGV